MKMVVKINVPIRFFGKTWFHWRVTRRIPTEWDDLRDMTQKMLFVRRLFLLPTQVAQMRNLQDILRLPKRFFRLIPADTIVVLLEKLEWLHLQPTTKPAFQSFVHEGRAYYFPQKDFLDGSAQEFALLDDFYREYVESKGEDEQAFLSLFATLARPFDLDGFRRTGYPRTPLSSDPQTTAHDIAQRAEALKNVDFSLVIAAIRYYEGIAASVHKKGVAFGIFQKKKDDDEEKKPQKQDNALLFGWWSVYRAIAKGQNKTEEEIWAMSFWRVFQIMMEEKQQQKALEKNTP